MKLTTLQKCHTLAYLFLIAVTGVEIAMLASIFDVVITSGKMYAVVFTPVVFNIGIWFVAIMYQTIKESILGKDNE